MIAVIQLRQADLVRLEDYLMQYHAQVDVKPIKTISELLQDNYERFVLGRTVWLAAMIVAMALIIDSFVIEERFRDHHPYVAWVNGVAPWAMTPLKAVLFGLPVTALISTLIPYWIAQLPPHILADNRGIRFMRMPGAKWLTHFFLGLSNYDAGAPSLAIVRLLQKRGHFSEIEDLGIGDKHIYEALASYYGYGISRRCITIGSAVNSVNVIDEVEHKYKSLTEN